MLKFYYNPLSPNARRVRLTLLEKGIQFEPIVLNLDGDQLQPEFQEINPFHHIPVIVDNGFRIVESLAILDYLESPPYAVTCPDKLSRQAVSTSHGTFKYCFKVWARRNQPNKNLC